MVVNKRKKNARQRGSTTHGYGSMKKNRGAGNRGGRGNAGSGKRGDSTKPCFWKKRHFGKFGFKSKGVKRRINAVSIRYLEENLDSLLNKKLIYREGGFYIVDMEKLGFNKLLSEGRVSSKFKINVPYASKKAVEKIKDSGGEVNLVGGKTDNKKADISQ
jgi:large subunit ribosomal protein L15